MANSTDNEGVSKRVERRTSAEMYHIEEAVRKGMWMGEIKWRAVAKPEDPRVRALRGRRSRTGERIPKEGRKDNGEAIRSWS
jgi:hypothetical protein